MLKIDKTLPLLLPILIILLTQDLFWPFSGTSYAPNFLGDIYSKTAAKLEKIIPLITFGFIIYYMPKTKKAYLFISIFIISYFAFLVFESLYYYQSFVEFPHVFFKILVLSIVIAFFIFYRKYKFINIHLLMNILFYMIILKIISTPGALSKSAFISHIRLIPSESVFLFILPFLYFFNNYVIHHDKASFIKFFVLLLLIIYFQHRSVWAACFVGILMNLIILVKQNKLDTRKAAPYIFSSLLLFSVLFILVAAGSPEIVNKIDQEIINIFNPQEDQTGNWRLLQFESYLPFIKKNLLFGMRLKGFELPVQFYNLEAGKEVFESNTGHHFHSFYVDLLFYFGLVGLFIFLAIILIPLSGLFILHT